MQTPAVDIHASASEQARTQSISTRPWLLMTPSLLPASWLTHPENLDIVLTGQRGQCDEDASTPLVRVDGDRAGDQG
ncbi:hypothetical protein [Candidatus Poriferisodalis sp.]|uniref:hypothetical protein n=1 Tax=Candidatus Poriferisodalis sp. TaxID=3101277 RepID=UPI003B523747